MYLLLRAPPLQWEFLFWYVGLYLNFTSLQVICLQLAVSELMFTVLNSKYQCTVMPHNTLTHATLRRRQQQMDRESTVTPPLIRSSCRSVNTPNDTLKARNFRPLRHLSSLLRAKYILYYVTVTQVAFPHTSEIFQNNMYDWVCVKNRHTW